MANRANIEPAWFPMFPGVGLALIRMSPVFPGSNSLVDPLLGVVGVSLLAVAICAAFLLVWLGDTTLVS